MSVPQKNIGRSSCEEETPHAMPKEHTDILSGSPDILTLEQAAEVLQISMTNARGMCRERRLPSFKVAAQWRIPRAWLEEYIMGGGNNAH